jgi:uncharacterized membrane protein YozB (DUF420 family)
MDLKILPTINAMLNATSGLLIITGFLMIRRRKVGAHRFCMTGAVTASILFLGSYVFYHYHAGATPFTGTGWVRPLYFTILISHTILAIVLVPLVIVTLRRALKSEFGGHRAIARWTFPVWLYVSVTGVIVYLMLYHIYPSP